MDLQIQEVPECAVCLQSCNHPARLPCGHIFCFLCAKGVAIQNKRCAMCRQDIPPDYLDHPVLLEPEPAGVQCAATPASAPAPCQQSFQWYYEGRNGWWMYDERSNGELEAAHGSGAAECALLLAGALYLVDFRTMLQYRRNDITRRRRVKRDTPAAPAKGIAGIKISSGSERTKSVENADDAVPESQIDGDTVRSSNSLSQEVEASPDADVQRDNLITPPPQFHIVHALRSLSLDDAVTAGSTSPTAERE